MNFGKNSTQKKRKQLSSASSKRGKRAGVTFLRILFLSFAAVCVIFCCMGIGAFRAILDTAPDISDVNIMPSGNATFVYDADGNHGKQRLRHLFLAYLDFPEHPHDRTAQKGHDRSQYHIDDDAPEIPARRQNHSRNRTIYYITRQSVDSSFFFHIREAIFPKLDDFSLYLQSFTKKH